ncbi:cation:proton antiporter [Ferruginibacter yonginensis]|uniref:Cation:proton antiporter n=1 Tax=Ferruginibacter yonginensis TaxID=1310416 RepID=A0ABV8QRZ5_9BACT
MTHLPILITDLAIILATAAVTTILFKWLKQPLVLGYIIAGFIVGPYFHVFPTVSETKSIQTWADIGVIFLLFGLGLEFSFKKLIKVGGTAIITAIIEVSATISFGFLAGKLLGWSMMDCIFFGGILGIASTTIIIRAFDELGLKNRKFAGVVMGVLVIEDLVAVLLLVLLSTLAVSSSVEGDKMLIAVVKLGFFLTLWFLSGIFFIPTFFKVVKKMLNNETLLIVAIAFCLGMVYLADLVGFSAALGAFIMGSILAETTEGVKIEHLLAPVKDLFGAIFFVSVGMLIDPAVLVQHPLPILLGTLILLFIKPLFVLIGALLSGQPLRSSLQAGMTLSQIGEFSFIIATLGLSLNVTQSFLYPVAVAISVITSFTTPYMMRLSEPLLQVVEKILPMRLQNSINRYSAAAQSITHVGDFRRLIRSFLMHIIINAVIIVSIVLISLRLLPLFFTQVEKGNIFITCIIFLLSAPFLWALVAKRSDNIAYSTLWQQKRYRGPLIMLATARVLIAVVMIGFICSILFSTVVALFLTGGIITLLIVFSKQLNTFYSKIELRFINNFYEKEQLQQLHEPPKALAPWDAHIAFFEVDADAVIIGQTLEANALREKFGINIAMIERGKTVIVTPTKYTVIYPNDKLTVIGTDEQLKVFRLFMQTEASTIKPSVHKKQQITLKQLMLQPSSKFVDTTIQASHIRELSKGIVVGVERDGERILNPTSSFILKAYDTVWIVGNIARLQILTGERIRKNVKKI